MWCWFHSHGGRALISFKVCLALDSVSFKTLFVCFSVSVPLFYFVPYLKKSSSLSFILSTKPPSDAYVRYHLSPWNLPGSLQFVTLFAFLNLHGDLLPFLWHLVCVALWWFMYLFYVGIVQLLSCIRLFMTPWTTAHQPSLSSTVSWSLLRFMLFELVMQSNHLILFHPLPFAFNLSQHQGLFPLSLLFLMGGQSMGASTFYILH